MKPGHKYLLQIKKSLSDLRKFYLQNYEQGLHEAYQEEVWGTAISNNDSKEVLYYKYILSWKTFSKTGRQEKWKASLCSHMPNF